MAVKTIYVKTDVCFFVLCVGVPGQTGATGAPGRDGSPGSQGATGELF